MLAADQSTDLMPTSCSSALDPIHHGTISVHHTKKGYDYPVIRLPHTLSMLVGLPTRIYQTMHKGALAFLVVIAPPHTASENDEEESNNAVTNSESVALTWRRSPVRIRTSPFVLSLSSFSKSRFLKRSADLINL
jgi:hypothetical protein